MLLKLACKSLWNRRGSAVLTIAAIAVAIFVLLGVEHLRSQARENFASTVSGVDLIVGARTGSVNLLLYSVFRVGSPTNNISWDSYEVIASRSEVEWALPIALGDSHQGYRVMGTISEYFQHFSYGNQNHLEFERGSPFYQVLDVVLGAEVAAHLGYGLGDELVLAHGVGSTSFSRHDDVPFTVVGILNATGTPVDQTLFVSLQGIEAMHSGWRPGMRLSGAKLEPENVDETSAEPQTITAFMLGLTSRMSTFRVQREINHYAQEPLLAIMPGVALAQLWQTTARLEDTMRLISTMVLFAAVLGLSAMLLASIREREREIQLLRIIGAPAFTVFLLIEVEALLISLLGIVLGVIGLSACMVYLDDVLRNDFGLHLQASVLAADHLPLLLLVLLSALSAAAIPSLSAYRSASVAHAT